MTIYNCSCTSIRRFSASCDICSASARVRFALLSSFWSLKFWDCLEAWGGKNAIQRDVLRAFAWVSRRLLVWFLGSGPLRAVLGVLDHRVQSANLIGVLSQGRKLFIQFNSNPFACAHERGRTLEAYDTTSLGYGHDRPVWAIHHDHDSGTETTPESLSQALTDSESRWWDPKCFG